MGERGFPRAEPVTGYAIPGGGGVSTLKSYVQVTLNKWKGLSFYICYVIIFILCVHAHTQTQDTHKEKEAMHLRKGGEI